MQPPQAGLANTYERTPVRALMAVWWPSFVVWLAMLALVCGSLLCVHLPLGRWSFPLLIGIALVQAGLVAWFFMQIDRASSLNRLTSASAFVFIAVMFVFTLTDLFTRF